MDTNKMRDDLPSLVKQSIETHPGYAEFVAWCEGELIHPYPIYFLIWQASREAVVVELPEALCSAALDEVEVAEVLLAGQGLSNLAGAIGCAYLICKELPVIRSAIEAQGLKVAP